MSSLCRWRKSGRLAFPAILDRSGESLLCQNASPSFVQSAFDQRKSPLEPNTDLGCPMMKRHLLDFLGVARRENVLWEWQREEVVAGLNQKLTSPLWSTSCGGC